jgi:hypothetical protein
MQTNSHPLPHPDSPLSSDFMLLVVPSPACDGRGALPASSRLPRRPLRGAGRSAGGPGAGGPHRRPRRGRHTAGPPPGGPRGGRGGGPLPAEPRRQQVGRPRAAPFTHGKPTNVTVSSGVTVGLHLLLFCFPSLFVFIFYAQMSGRYNWRVGPLAWMGE